MGAERPLGLGGGLHPGGAAALGGVAALVGGRGGEVGDRVEAVAVGHPPRRQEAAYVDRFRLLGGAPGAPGGADPTGPRVDVEAVRRARRRRGRASGPAGSRASGRSCRRTAGRPATAARGRCRWRAARRGRPRARRGACGSAAAAAGAAQAAVTGLGVEDDRLRDDQGAVPGAGGAPAEVDVGGEQRQLGVEAAELLEHLAADQHAGGVDREHLADLVVLALVVLAPLQTGLPAAGGRDGDAELEEPAQRGPLAELGAEDVGVGVSAGGDQLEQRAGLGVGVVVQHPHPLGVEHRQRRWRRRRGTSRRRSRTASEPRASVSRPRVSAPLPVSTARMRSRRLSCCRRHGRQPRVGHRRAGHRAPSGRLTREGGDCHAERPYPQCGQVRRRASSACVAPARTGHPRYRNARRS